MLEALGPCLSHFTILQQQAPRDNLAFVRVPKAELHALLETLDRDEGFMTLTGITCVDWIEEERFTLTYLLENSARDRCLGVQTDVKRDGESLPTCLGRWPQAEIYERELHEMYGIPFDGHPSLIDFMLEGWTNTPPLRREFDTLKFVQETFEMRGGREDNLDVRSEIRKRKEAKRAEKAAQAAKPTQDATTPASARTSASRAPRMAASRGEPGPGDEDGAGGAT
ncbi:NADH:ubiquinone oxidoreductase [Thiocapsa imhoffii]|uniref:NADH:ubiquinone oxidoreductase n=1 Tax=Thiocapsa imhoffii TaxID=382777 RepID=A0A9X0WKZ5_9GAMM|nr:NADH-quinone oxidoreductase subunit C [Thiocapsa imhoffii]MBK1646299.1 NADH:ubiquinone oxidoreductase [Thiocapsa imhoffii]